MVITSNAEEEEEELTVYGTMGKGEGRDGHSQTCHREDAYRYAGRPACGGIPAQCVMAWGAFRQGVVLVFVGCFVSQRHSNVSHRYIRSEHFSCCKTEVANQTLCLTQSQYTDTGPASPSADPITRVWAR